MQQVAGTCCLGTDCDKEMREANCVGEKLWNLRVDDQKRPLKDRSLVYLNSEAILRCGGRTDNS